jgi:hypothetical protein
LYSEASWMYLQVLFDKAFEYGGGGGDDDDDAKF